MRIILSPTKKMKENPDYIESADLPMYLAQTEEILEWLNSQSGEQLKKLWNCSDKIVHQNLERLNHMDLRKRLSPAILSYEGLAFQYMAPAVMERTQLEYLQSHLRILSAFYGVLRPMDGVTPYRLEMQAKADIQNTRSLYEYWGRRIYDGVRDDSGVIVNLASKEYSKCIEKYLTDQEQFITVTFCEKAGEKLVTKGTYAKMARGEMVRYMAENEIEDTADIKGFRRLGYLYREELSTDKEYVFERISEK